MYKIFSSNILKLYDYRLNNLSNSILMDVKSMLGEIIWYPNDKIYSHDIDEYRITIAKIFIIC